MDHPGLFYLEQDLRRRVRRAWHQTARYLEQHPEEDAGRVWARALERNARAFAYQLPVNLYDWGITEEYSELSHAAEVSLRVRKTSPGDPIRKGEEYRVEKGDTLSGIAKKNGITLEQLYEVNPGLKAQDPRRLAVGTVLTLPYGAPFRMKAQIEVFVPLNQARILEAYYNLGLLRRLTGVKALDLQYYRDPRSPSPLAHSSFGNPPPPDTLPNSRDQWDQRDAPSSYAPRERNSHHDRGPGPWIEGYEQRNRLDDNPAYPHYLMSAYDLRRKDTVQVQPYRKPPLKLSPHVNEPNQAFQLAPLIPALEEVSGKVIGRSLLAGAGWILTLLCLSGDTRREPLEMLPRGEDWPGPISSSVYDQLSAEEAQRYNELRYKKAAGKASEQESRDFQELEEKLVEGDVVYKTHANELIRGKYSGREFDPSKSGGPIEKLDWRNATFDQANIDDVKKHLGRLDPDPWNDAMIKRLENINAENIKATDYDKRFITHEIKEFERYKKLGYETDNAKDIPEDVWNNTHTATLEDYEVKDYIIKPDGSRDYQLYHPDVQQIPE